MEEYLEYIQKKMVEYLTEKKFTGDLTFTLHCRQGGVSRSSLEVREDFTAIKK